MSYVDAGYAVGLSFMFLYALSLVVRRRRLERRIEVEAARDGAGGETSAEPR
jgi:hypothetical protein